MKILTLLRNWKSAKSAFSTLAHLYAKGDGSLDALGGLTAVETAALTKWLPERGTFVEIGTLFGLTALAVKRAHPALRVVAVDDFSWNPFGLPPSVHEAFARRILDGGGVELVRATSEAWRARNERPDAIFLDASHAYEDVKRECVWAKERGIPVVTGHDYGNANPHFGVTRAVDETFGPGRAEVVGMCWRIRA